MSGRFWGLCILLTAAFALGGGARGDIQSLMILRPLAILLLGYGLLGLRTSHIAAHRFLLAMALAILALLVVHLIPLPPPWWSRLPGRDLVSQIDNAAGLGQLWRPLSLAPAATLNALYAALLPLAVLVLGLQLEPRERHALVWLVIAFGGISALLGLAQSAGGQNSPLRFYKVTNDFGAVGLFANRNHQALLLAMLLPMLAVWAGMSGISRGIFASRKIPGLLAGIVLVPFILVTGSRAGLILAVVAMLLVPAVMLRTLALQTTGSKESVRHSKWRRVWLPILSVLGACAILAVLTIWLGRGLAFNRLLASAPDEELRILIVPTMLSMILSYLPLGSGLGSFERVYQIHEPAALLIPTYANHAHNDWLELAMTGGIPALLGLLVAMIAFLKKARELWAPGVVSSPELQFARLGWAIMLLSALASFIDYPLRVPSLGCIFVVALLWISCPLPKFQPIGVTS